MLPTNSTLHQRHASNATMASAGHSSTCMQRMIKVPRPSDGDSYLLAIDDLARLASWR